DAVVVNVELVPGEAVACADRVGVMVIVPAFAARQKSDPPVVAGVVLGLEAALAPEVGSGVDEPGGVESDGDAQESSPKNHADGAYDVVAGTSEQAADDKLKHAGGDERNPMVFAQPDVNRIFGKVGGVAAEQ